MGTAAVLDLKPEELHVTHIVWKLCLVPGTAMINGGLGLRVLLRLI
jgi:hypothetical protein